MKTLASYFAGLLIVSTFAAAAQTKETRAVGDFTQIKASGSTTIYLSQGAQTSVVVEAPEEVQPYLKVETRGGQLYVYRESEGLTATVRSWFGSEKNGAKIYVTCPHLTGLELSGATDVNGRTPFAADDFTITASGASDVRLELTAKTLTVNASGASDVYLSGQVERQQVHISGSSDYHAAKLRSQQATVNASGSSDAYVSAERLQSHASGASDVHNQK